MSNSICEDCGLPFVICQAVGSVRMALKYRDAAEVAQHVLPLLSDQADLRAIQAERDELRTAIFGSPDYATDLRNGNFREMAETLHAARAGGVARAEAAEAKLAEVEKERVEQWNLRRDADGSRDAARAAADTMRAERDAAEATVARLTAQVEAMRGAAEVISDDVCSYICPSTGKAGTPIPHDPRCVTLRAAISDAKGGRDA